jgi:hypothetical protein
MTGAGGLSSSLQPVTAKPAVLSLSARSPQRGAWAAVAPTSGKGSPNSEFWSPYRSGPKIATGRVESYERRAAVRCMVARPSKRSDISAATLSAANFSASSIWT